MYEMQKSLSEVPEIPSELFGKIQKKIYSKKRNLTLLYAVAASLLLLLGSLSIVLHRHDTTINEEVADELQMLHDYVNGNDLDNDLETYAIINNY
jgi:hypothetical protein